MGSLPCSATPSSRRAVLSLCVCECVCLCLWECVWMDTKCGYAEAQLCPLCAGIYGCACVRACTLMCVRACAYVLCVRACVRLRAWS